MYISQALGNENEDYKRIIEGIASLPQHIENILKDEKTFEHYASYLKDLKDAYYIGRSLDYATVLEGALKLKEVFELEDINDLPIAFNIAWYEQKAVIVLLSLLYLGVKNIHLGPTLPAFLSPNVAKVLVENFGIGGITNVEDGMKMFLN